MSALENRVSRGTVEFWGIYNVLFMFSLGGAREQFQGEFHFIIKSENVYEVVPCYI